MKCLELKPQILKFKSTKDFSDEFCLNSDDLVFTNRFLYEQFFKNLDLKCGYIFQEDYKFREPSDEVIDRIIKDTSSIEYKRIVAAGGGSIIDIAKILSLKSSGTVCELFEGKVSSVKERELIIIPTTCGTGSEVTNISIAEIKSKETKLGLVSPELYADYAVLITELVRDLPYEFFIYSSIDALIHGVESFLSPRANSYTDLFAKEAIGMILKGYMQLIDKGVEYRKKIVDDFLTASNYAGISFDNAGVGAVHALSYPLGAKYHVPHGEANYQFFTEVLEYYMRMNSRGKISMLNGMLKDILNIENDKEIYTELESMLSRLISRKRLRDYGMKMEDIYAFADSVIDKQQRLLVNSYIPVNKNTITEMYENLY